MVRTIVVTLLAVLTSPALSATLPLNPRRTILPKDVSVSLSIDWLSGTLCNLLLIPSIVADKMEGGIIYDRASAPKCEAYFCEDDTDCLASGGKKDNGQAWCICGEDEHCWDNF